MGEWGFQKQRKDEPVSGGAEQFAISRKVHNFVRESLQNSWDQRVSGADPVKVVFSFVELEGDELQKFLDEINWSNGLEVHLELCADQNNHEKAKLRRNLDKFRNGKLRVLVVSDHNTNGLVGPEFGVEGNFCKLCRNKMIPSEGGKNAARGGSFGVGKSVYWAFSGLNTVIFSSLYQEDGEAEKSRIFGRTYLPDHKMDDGHGGSDTFSGDAYLCERDSEGQRVSMTFAGAGIKPGSLLYRSPGDRGTSIIVVMYEELESEEEHSLAEVAARFRDAIAANFWPMLTDGLLDATVEWKNRGGVGSEKVGVPSEFDPFVRALQYPQDTDVFAGEETAELLEPGKTGFFSASIVVPARKVVDDSHPASPDAQVAVSVTRLTEEEKAALIVFEERYKDMKFVNRLANVRGAKMVVENFEYVSGACFDHVGVVRAGRFRDIDANVSIDDERVEQFLRDSEPPAHDNWKLLDKVRNAYATPYKNVVGNMYSDVSTKARKLLRAVLKGDKDRPDGLAKLLVGKPIGIDPPTGDPKYRSQMSCNFDITAKRVSCVISVKRLGAAKQKRLPWIAKVGVVAVGDQFSPHLHHVSAIVAQSFPTVANGTALDVGTYSVSVPADKDTFDITLQVALGSLSETVIRRLRLDHTLNVKEIK
jgi:hypothetical protein